MAKRGTLSIEVAAADDGKRLDKFVAEKLGGEYSRTFLQTLIRDQRIVVDGVSRKKHYEVRPGERVEVDVPEPRRSELSAEKMPLDIVYEDGHLCVVNKRPDMVVHPAPGNYSGTLVNALLWHCKRLSGIGGVMKPGIVHRLDKDTSGLIVVAKTDAAHRSLAKQFKEKTAKRIYVAVVNGVVQFDNGIIDAPIGRDKRDRMKMAIDFESDKSRDATTRYRVIKRFKDATVIELALGTGRTHQVRIHMAHIGHPVLGDVKYGARCEALKRPMLHAKSIGFIHPAKKKYMELESDLPRDMKRYIALKERDIMKRKA